MLATPAEVQSGHGLPQPPVAVGGLVDQQVLRRDPRRRPQHLGKDIGHLRGRRLEVKGKVTAGGRRRGSLLVFVVGVVAAAVAEVGLDVDDDPVVRVREGGLLGRKGIKVISRSDRILQRNYSDILIRVLF